MAIDKADVLAEDWEIASVAEIGVAGALGAGIFFFMLRSQTANVTDQLMLAAAGIGFGGSIGSAAGPSWSDLMRSDGKISYSSIACERAFSLRDLDRSLGMVGQASAAIPLISIGYSMMHASARTLDGVLFRDADVSGIAFGVGAAAFRFVGMWRSGMLTARSINNAQYRGLQRRR